MPNECVVKSRGAFRVFERVYSGTSSRWTRVTILNRILLILSQAENVKFIQDLHAIEPLLLRMPTVEQEGRMLDLNIDGINSSTMSGMIVNTGNLHNNITGLNQNGLPHLSNNNNNFNNIINNDNSNISPLQEIGGVSGLATPGCIIKNTSHSINAPLTHEHPYAYLAGGVTCIEPLSIEDGIRSCGGIENIFEFISRSRNKKALFEHCAFLVNNPRNLMDMARI